MSVVFTSPDETASQTNVAWERRLDALLAGECSEDEFLDGLSNSRGTPDSAWSVVALLDQRHRLGQVPIDLFRSIQAKIAQRELITQDYGNTIEFEPNPVPRVVTQRLFPDAPVDSAPDPSISPDVEVEIDSAPDPSTSPDVEIGRVLRNRYVLESRLGRGGMGTVFKALDRYRCDLPEDNRHVAIKFLHEKIGGARVLSNLRREFYGAQALCHPNIVKVYELELDGDAAFFTMELLEGELLSDLIERRDPQTISRAFAWTLIQEVGAALAHAHSRNVAHGDLKPHNIMITKSGEVRLLDFGASSAPSRQLSSADTTHARATTALTPAYASCELLEGRSADPRDDLYALACLSYELLAGNHPFERRRSSEARDRGMLALRPPGLTGRQWETLRTGLAWKRQDRSMTVRDWIAGLTPPPPATSRWKPLYSTPPRRAAAATLAVLSVSIILGLGLWVSFRVASFDRKIGGDAAVTASAATTPPVVIPVSPAATSPVVQDAASAAAPSVAQAAAPPPRTAEAMTRRPRSSAAAEDPAMGKHNTSLISLSADGYRIRRGQNFAEIRVRRSAASAADTSFAWWTEPSTAKRGVDYVAQDRITQLLPRGKRTASLFIRLIPNPSRNRPAVFYVVIGEPGKGASLGRARTAVELPVSDMSLATTPRVPDSNASPREPSFRRGAVSARSPREPPPI